MSITLGTIALPDNLIWEDEFAWSPVTRTLRRHPGGWYIERTAAANNPRPITLVGGRQGLTSWAWITRANLLTLQALLEQAGPHRLTLHDARAFDVYAIGEAGVVDATPLPTIGERAPPNPGATSIYVLNRLPLVGVAV